MDNFKMTSKESKEFWISLKLSVGRSYKNRKWWEENGWRYQQLLVNLIKLKLI